MTKRKNKRILPPLLFLFLLVAGLLVFGYASGLSNVGLTDILAATKRTSVSVNFNNRVSAGSPLVFGVNHGPSPTETGAWDLLSDSGVNLIRMDFDYRMFFPGMIIDDYRNNKNNIQDSSTWVGNAQKNYPTRWMTIPKMQAAKKRGMKVMGIVDWIPYWLSYNKNTNGVPTDWAIYEDIIYKSYKLYRPYLDYVEIFNEPDLARYLDVTGSNMTREDAYLQIFLHASSAIMRADREAADGKRIQIGGCSEASADQAPHVCARLLQDATARSRLSFISYHSYWTQKDPTPGYYAYKSLLSQYNLNIPMYITEWNLEGGKYAPEHTEEVSIPYSGYRLLELLKIKMPVAIYFAGIEYNPQKTGTMSTNWGMYRYVEGVLEALPQTKTWKLLSRTLGLSGGENIIYESISYDTNINIIAVKNSGGRRGVILLNRSTDPYSVILNMDTDTAFNLVAPKFLASMRKDMQVRVAFKKSSIENSYMATVTVPPLSLAAVILD